MTDLSRQLIDEVSAACGKQRPLHIKGGGTKQQLCGRNTEGEPLNVAAHTGIVNYDPAELVITARAGTPITELEVALDENKQMLSFEPPHFGSEATLGGTLASNLSGPARPWSGSIRDLVLGVRLINGKGDHLQFGGQVMKNVAGYDVARLQAGALGCLGVITEVSLKVIPQAETEITVVQQASESEAITAMNSFSGVSRPLTGAAWVDGQLYLRLAGAESAVKGTVRAWGGEQLGQDTTFWQDLREQRLRFFQSSSPLWRFSIRSNVGPLLADVATVIDWAGAQRWLYGDYQANELQMIAERAGGHVCLFKGGDRRSEVQHPLSPVAQQLQQRLKNAFDPKGILNPGRLYRWM